MDREALTSPGPAGRPAAPLAVLEILGADGHVRQSVPVAAWPVAIGRAVDNDVVLADPHVAPHHLKLVRADAAAAATGTGAAGLFAEVGDTRNGIELAAQRGAEGTTPPRRLDAGTVARLDDLGAPALIEIGRTRLRLRLPEHALEPELPLALPASDAPAAGRWRRAGPLLAGALVLAALVVFQRWLEAEPEHFRREAGAALLALAGTGAAWCGAWALLSRIFTRQARFGWHLRVFVGAGVAWLLVDGVASVLSFALDWTALADFAFVASLAVAGTALTWHLYAVEPARPRLARTLGVLAAAGGIALAMWNNHQRTDRLGNDLYLSHLLPPSFRLAGTQPVDRFVDGLAALQPVLDRKARRAGSDDGGDDAAD